MLFQVFVSFASMAYNPDTGIKDPHFTVLNFRIQPPRNSEPLKYPSLGHKRTKIQDSPKGGHLQLVDKNNFPDGVR